MTPAIRCRACGIPYESSERRADGEHGLPPDASVCPLCAAINNDQLGQARKRLAERAKEGAGGKQE